MKKENILILIGATIGASIGVTAFTISQLNKLDLVSDKKEKVKKELKEEKEEVQERKYICIGFDKVKDFVHKKKGKEVVEGEISKVDETATYFDEYFYTDVNCRYQDYIPTFIEENGKDSLKYVKREIFDEYGLLDVNNLVEFFTSKYDDIVKILLSDVYSLPVKPLPLESYLEEIKNLSNMEDEKEKLFGILSYWISINEVLGRGVTELV